MAAPHRPLLCISLAALVAAGCDSTARTIAGQPSAEGDGCTTCHGDSSRIADSSLVEAAPATGAHLAHLQGQTFRDPIACSECHPVPHSPAHVNQRVDLAFGPLASARGITASYDGATCTTACHGAAPSPAWTSDPTLGCASCHGLPPSTAPHAPSMSIQECSTCHPGTVLASGALNRASKLHINGEIDVSAFHPATWSSPAEHGGAAMTQLGACAACHGQDFAGGSSGVSCNACHQTAGHASWTTDCTFCHGNPPSTGEHRKHVAEKGVACAACHSGVMPAQDVTAGSALHANGVKNVVFGGTRNGNAVSGTWNPSTRTCSSLSCHDNETW